MSQMKLLSQKNFGPLFWTQFLGALNDNLLKNSLVILVTFKSAAVLGLSAVQMVPIASGIFILPFFLFSATAGQLADKYEKSLIIRWIKLAEIGIMLLATYGFLFHQYAFLLLVLFLMGLHSTFFGPLKYSILPQHLNSEDLVGGNALIEAGTFLAILIGTILGGVLVTLEPGGPLWVSGGLILVAVAGWFASRKIPQAEPTQSTLQVEWNPFPPTWRIYKFTKKNRAVYLSILGISWFWLFGAALLSLFPSYAKDYLQGNELVVTYLLATFSIGIGIGSLLCEKLSREHLELGLVPLGSIGMSFFACAVAFVPGPFSLNAPWVIGTLLLFSLFSGFYIVPLYTLVQERSEVTHRSRIIAANNILNAFFMVIATGLVLLFQKLGMNIPQMFFAFGVLNAIVAIYIYTLLPEFLLRFMMWILAHFLYRLKITGTENIPKKGPAVLICNHVTFVDWMIIGAAVKRPVRFIMDHSFAKGFFVKMFLRQGKAILIAPKWENEDLMEKAFARAKFELSDQEIVCIFPEGKLTKTGEMNAFKTGVLRILEETPVPVIPMGLVGLWGSYFSREGGRALLKRPKRFWSRVELHIGRAIPPEKATLEVMTSAVTNLVESP